MSVEGGEPPDEIAKALAAGVAAQIGSHIFQ
jgi:hypothetical protein